MNNKESYFNAIAWSLGCSVKYVKDHYEDYIQVYEFNPEHFYSVIELFLKKDNGRVITKYGFQ